MQDGLDDLARLGMSGAVSWALFWTPKDGRPKTLVCAACGHYGLPLSQAWERPRCAACGEKRLVPADSPMAAGYWQCQSRRKARRLPPPAP
ncbi:hypothetical protein [Caldimonas tepidiphila]|uniref:hypothetical protein n=1 Tax=Caldimonas tepidiphila TaxID=2315841 RepID=UPI000E5B116F|nr:hypothetical protein [Caldimonas tepidiphila]